MSSNASSFFEQRSRNANTVTKAKRNPEIEDPFNQQLPARVGQASVATKDTGTASVIAALSGVGLVRPNDAELAAKARAVGERMGEAAFYRFKAGKGFVSGPSVKLARTLAQVYGFVKLEIEDPSIDYTTRRVTVAANCVDLLNAVFIRRPHAFTMSSPPGRFAKDVDQVNRWNSMQINSGAARAQRNAIIDCLPDWLVAEAVDAAMEEARKVALGSAKTITEARKAVVSGFLEFHNATQEDLENYCESPMSKWSTSQIADFRKLWQALDDGDVTFEVAFGHDKPERAPAKKRGGRRRGKQPEPTPTPQPEPTPPEPPVEPQPEPTPPEPAPTEPPAPENSNSGVTRDQIRSMERRAGGKVIEKIRGDLGIPMPIPLDALSDSDFARYAPAVMSYISKQTLADG